MTVLWNRLRFKLMLQLPQVNLTSFLESGACFLGLEAAKRVRPAPYYMGRRTKLMLALSKKGKIFKF